MLYAGQSLCYVYIEENSWLPQAQWPVGIWEGISVCVSSLPSACTLGPSITVSPQPEGAFRPSVEYILSWQILLKEVIRIGKGTPATCLCWRTTGLNDFCSNLKLYSWSIMAIIYEQSSGILIWWELQVRNDQTVGRPESFHNFIYWILLPTQ